MIRYWLNVNTLKATAQWKSLCSLVVAGNSRASTTAVVLLTMLLLVMQPLAAQAVGFGPLQLHSHLNEPLDAEVAVLLAAGETVDQLQLVLASRQEYRTMGLVWQADLERVNISRLKRQANGAVVRLFTTTAVTSPMLSLVLKASKAGRGTYFRQYRLLFDAAETPIRTGQPEVIPLHDKTEPTPGSMAGQWSRSGRYGPVRSGDNLGRIAQRLRKDKRFSNNQVVYALYESNKQAFTRGDINRIKVGSWLDVPEASVVNAYGSRASMRRLRDLFARNSVVKPRKKQPAAHSASATVADNLKHVSMQYSGRIGLKPVNAGGHDVVAQDGQQLASLHEQLLAGKLQMTNLGESVAALTTTVGSMQQNMQLLRKDVSWLKQQQLASTDEGGYQSWLYLLLAVLSGLLAGLLLQRQRNRLLKKPGNAVVTVSRDTPSVKSAAQPEAATGPESSAYVTPSQHGSPASYPQPSDERSGKTAGEQESKLVALQLVDNEQEDGFSNLMNKVEDRLSRCDYEEAARLLDQLDAQPTVDKMKVAALRALLLHETGRLEERNSLINGISESSDSHEWQQFCQHLPAQVGNACFGDTAYTAPDDVVDRNKQSDR